MTAYQKVGDHGQDSLGEAGKQEARMDGRVQVDDRVVLCGAESARVGDEVGGSAVLLR